MSPMRFLRRREPPPPVEDPVVRQYRYLLRTAPLDALEAVHEEAFGGLHTVIRSAILRAVRERVVAGERVGPDDVRDLARLHVLAERREPGALISSLEEPVLHRLAQRAVLAEAAFGLLAGYAAWDGLDPEPEPQPWAEDGFGERWREERNLPPSRRDHGGPWVRDLSAASEF